MKTYLQRIALAAVLGMAGMGIVTADQWDKKTVITIDEAMQLPNTTLQPGTYVIKLLNSDGNRHVVQFFDKDEKHLVTTILAIPNMRLQPRGKSVFAFWEVPAGQPKALRAWFYPGDNFGQEFAYHRQEASQITASNSGANVPIDDTKSDDVATTAAVTAEPAPAPVAAPQPTPAPVEVAAAPQPPPAPVAATEPVSPPAVDTNTNAQVVGQTSAPAQSLPQTASNLPLIGLLGFLSLAAALALKVAYLRS